MATKTKTKKTKVAPTTNAAPTTNTAPTTNAAGGLAGGLAGGQVGGHPDQGGLSIGDLKNISTVLDVASTRGAFRANEMATVGLIYNKLQAFLAKVAPPEAKKNEAETKISTPAKGVGEI